VAIEVVRYCAPPGFAAGKNGQTSVVTEPTETPKRAFRRAARGRDPQTPMLVISGVTLVVAVAVAVLVAVALAIYFTI
jgi:hypothetical protein